MKTLIKKLSFKWDVIRGRFQFFIVSKKEDFDICIQILEEVRRKELNRVAGKSVLDSHSFSGEKLDYQLAACRDSRTNEIVGCMKLTNALVAKNVPASFQEYQLNLFSDQLLKCLTIFTRLAVLKSYRKTPAALALMSGAFMSTLEHGGQGVLLSCEPNLFSMYKSLGMQPIGSPHNSKSGGYRIPMIFLPDLKHLKKIKSPALLYIKNIKFEHCEPMLEWYQNRKIQLMKFQFEETQYQSIWEGKPIDHFITAGLSKQGRLDFLKNAMAIKCKKNDIIIAKNDGGKAIGIVKKGSVHVEIDGAILVELKEGDIFGEIAFVLNSQRTATLKAAEKNTEVLLFSVSAVKRLARESDKTIIWQNMAKVLANRLVLRTSI